MTPAKPTKAQRELLAWLVEREARAGSRHGEWRGGDLIDYYKTRAQNAGMDTRWAGSPRYHAWRRAGGRALRLLADAGYAKLVTFSHGVPQYVLTDAGREAVA